MNKELTDAMKVALADTFAFYLKAHNYLSRCKNKRFIVLETNDWPSDLEKIRYRLDSLGYYWHKDVWFGWEQRTLLRIIAL